MLKLLPLTLANLDAAIRLSTQAHWNQLPVDWDRLLTLWPHNCLGGWLDGQLVATGTLTTYPPSVGWIGMILVDEACRGQGYGGTIFRALVELAQSQGIARLGLDATDQGRPVYLKQGFGDHSLIRRWKLEAPTAVVPCASTSSRLSEPHDWPAILSMDRQAAGVNRAALLRHLAAEPQATTRVAEADGQIAGLGFSRAGREAGFIGPIVAASPNAANDLLAALLQDRRQHNPTQPIYADAMGNGPLNASMAGAGWQVMRTLTRMVRPISPGSLLNGPAIACGAGFELG